MSKSPLLNVRKVPTAMVGVWDWIVVDFRGRVYGRFPTRSDALYFLAAMSDDTTA